MGLRLLAVLLVVGGGLLLLPPAAVPASAQTALSMEGGARIAALGGTGAALTGPGAWTNPAGPATLDGRTAAFYATQGFGLSELRLGTLRYAEPLAGWGTVAGSARTFGFDAFRETAFALSYARGFSLGTARRVHAGVRARYYRLSLGDASDGASYGSAGTLGLSAGGVVQLVERLTLGATAVNLNAPAYTDSGPGLAQTLAVGLAYRPADRLLVTAAAHKDLDFPLSVRAGLEATPVEALAVRVGVSTRPARLTAGVGLRVEWLRGRLAFERHRTLGWTPAAELAVQW
jgi:hypothetical protein